MITVLEPLIMQLLAEGLLHRPARISAAGKAGLGFFILAGVLAVGGVVFMMISLHAWLLLSFTAELAALLTGASALLAAVLSGLCGLIAFRKWKERGTSRADDITRMIQSVLTMAGDQLQDPIRENPGTAMLVASLAGFFAGHKLH